MLNFNNISELRENEELRNMDRYGFRRVQLDGEDAFACTTNQQYEDIIWGGADDILRAIDDKYGTNVADGDLATEVRDFILAKLESEYKVRFVDVFDEY